MMDQASFTAGKTFGQAQVKTGQKLDKASTTAQSAKELIQETDQQMMAPSHGAADSVKDLIRWHE